MEYEGCFIASGTQRCAALKPVKSARQRVFTIKEKHSDWDKYLWYNCSQMTYHHQKIFEYSENGQVVLRIW